MFSALDLLALATVGLLGLLMGGLAATRWRRAGTALLTALLGVNAVAVGRGVLARHDVLGPLGEPLLVLVAASFFAIPPLLYGFAVQALEPDRALRPPDARHLIPAGLALGAVGTSAALLPSGQVLTQSGYLAFVVALNVVFVVYFGAAVRTALKVPEDRAVRTLLAVFGVHWVFSAGSSVLALAGAGAGWTTGFEAASWAMLGVFAAAAVVLGIGRWDALAPQPLKARPLPDAEAVDALALRAERYLRETQRFLDPLLSVDDVATELRVAPRELSRALNHGARGGFARTVNALRVAEAQRLLTHPDWAEATVLAVLHEAGFNSKSAFNRVFRDHTGTTPSAYRRQHLCPPSSLAA